VPHKTSIHSNQIPAEQEKFLSGNKLSDVNKESGQRIGNSFNLKY